ncbi:hydroxyacid dehydrogenase [Paenibacillus arenilitoris]|uniref:Hydroxyacid dehydrogenase n=1 Tax=Paenibacillus arenilitoris TaxID=2772299 RepID=A0A927CMC5_9BACL|nr:hydroxyacid dehydrogenase [Paenibacillus arenilitoris]MBD2870060.1 hydroxyacid dehydrogenase [Paenibacillus arenilitoris]
MKALVLSPASRLREVCSDKCRALLNEHFDVTWNETSRDYTKEELAELVSDVEVMITSWGSPSLTDDVLSKANKLRAVGHAAGSVKNLVPKQIFSRGVRVFSAAPRIALSVGEYCLAALLASLRYLPVLDASLRAGQWRELGLKGRELTGSTIGIISASSTARAFIKLLAPFQVNVLIYDPYLTEEAAAGLNARRASLEEVMSCPIISVHAPKLPATERMLSRELLALIPDGAVFINSSRGSVVDEQAFMEQLQSGRFFAALDVFEKEPLAADSPIRSLPNVLLTPHIAGASVQGHLSLMEEVVKDMIQGLNQENSAYEVNERMWEVMA